MKLDEYKEHVEAQRKASLDIAIATLRSANAMLEATFNLNESENN